MKAILICFFISLFFKSFLYAKTVEIKPSEVYAEVEKIEEELSILYDFKNIQNKSFEILNNEQQELDVDIQPRNVWQKCYQIMVKINVFRKKNNLPRIEEVNIEAVLNLEPKLVYEMTQRILTEIRIIKRLMGIDKEIQVFTKYKDKKPKDVYMYLQRISYKLDILNNEQTIPSDVYAQVMRIFDEISLVMGSLEITDITTPTRKNENAIPLDAFEAIVKLLNEIQFLQKKYGIKSINFDALRKDNIEPRDVFDMVIIAIAELQPIKASLGLSRLITPPAKHFQNKKPADVEQLILWNVERLRLISSNLNLRVHK